MIVGVAIGAFPQMFPLSEVIVVSEATPQIADALPDPELGLVLAGALGVGTFPTSTIQRKTDAVLAADFVGLDGSAGGLIAELGGVGTGAYAGFEVDGRFVIRFGQGGAQWQSGTCYAIAAAGVVAGDGTLVCEIRPGDPARARVWWNRVLVADNEVGVVNAWAGTDTATFLATSGQAPTGQIKSPAVYGGVSDLRYYAGQRSAL